MNNLTKTKVGGGKTFKHFLSLFLILLGCATGTWAQDYKLVTSDTELEAGANYIIASMSNGAGYVMRPHSFNTSKTNHQAIAATSTDNIIAFADGMAKLTLCGDATSGWQFQEGSNYMSATSTTRKATLKTSTDATDAYAQFTIAINTSAVITCKGKTKYHIVRFNPNTGGDPLFSAYTSNQQNVYLYKEVKEEVTKEVTSIAISGTPTTTAYMAGETPSADGLVVTATYDDETTAPVSGSKLAWTFAPAVIEEGTTQVTATATYDDTFTASTTFDVTVKKGIANTEETAYTVEEAVALIDANFNLDATVYVKGIISEVGTFNSKYGSLTYNISTDGTTTAQQFICYSGLNIGGAKFTGTGDVEVGAKVVVKGKLKKFNSDYEFDFNNEIVSYVGTPTIIASDVEYAAEITSGEISYEVKYADGSSLNATTTAEWISGVTVADGKVTFTMTENTETTPREATITLTCGELTKEVKVTQLGAKEKYTVTLADDASTLTEAVGGEGVTLPTREDVAPYTFMGWAAAELTAETTTEPTVFSGAYNPESNITLYPVYVRTEGSGAKETTASTTIADYATANGWTNGTQYSAVTLNDDITATAVGGANTGKYYTDGQQWRLYSTESAKLTISASGDATMSTVTLSFEGKSSLEPAIIKYNTTEIKTGEAVTVSGNEATFNVTGGQGRITAISVTYTVNSGTSYYTSHPVAAPTTATITLNAACTDGEKVYGTFSSSKAFKVSNDIIVSEITVENGKLLVKNYASGAIVPANTGVMVSAMKGGDYTVELSSEEGTSVLGTDNMLKPGSEAMSGDCKFYRLTMHGGKTLGFFWGAAEGAAFSIAADKAYLAVPTTMAANIQGFTFSDTETGINGINAAEGKQAIYNLQGQRVSRAVKGIYIVNGKKVIIK